MVFLRNEVIGIVQVVASYFQYIFFELASHRLTNRMRLHIFKATLSQVRLSLGTSCCIPRY